MSPCWCCWRSRAALCQAHRMEAKQHLLGVVLGISERPRTRVLLSQGTEIDAQDPQQGSWEPCTGFSHACLTPTPAPHGAQQDPLTLKGHTCVLFPQPYPAPMPTVGDT